jgi:hypothetical protein
MMSYPLIQLVHSDAFGSYPVGPHTLAWIDKIRARPAYQRARARLDQAKL